MGKYKFSLVDNVFEEQARKAPKGSPKPLTLIQQPSLGLLPNFDKGSSSFDENVPEPWARIRNYVDALNREGANNKKSTESPEGAKYKVIFLLRHGYSLHNYIEKGVKEVDKKGNVKEPNWRGGKQFAFQKEVSLEALRGFGCEVPEVLEAHLRGGGPNATAKVVLHDAALLPKEITEAIRGSEVPNNDAGDLGKQWLAWVKDDKFPLPDAIYTSPLRRCLETTRKVYAPVFEAHSRKFEPEIKEKLREWGNGDACNYRRTKSSILAEFPNYKPEVGFGDEDRYEYQIEVARSGVFAESPVERDHRMQDVLDAIFDDDETRIVSLTTHSFSIGALTRAFDHERILDEGGIAAFLVKAVPS
ncbi:hypothetical protein PG996_007605 [Apiospora saccharicola]|uniref:Phosphoglycerate mutase n=1 Tax=Apiospora saccharicola TaxID=335842 RepID=A0ABR1VF00_9PEZI